MVRPFKRVDDTVVAGATNVLLVLTFLTTIYIKVFDDIEDDTSNDFSESMALKPSQSVCIVSWQMNREQQH